MPDRSYFCSQRDIVGARTADLRPVDRLACSPVHDSIWKTGSGAILSLSHAVRFAAVDCAHVFAGRSGASRYRDSLFDNGRFGGDLLLDELSLVNAHSKRRAGATGKLDLRNLSGRGAACACAVLFGAGDQLQPQSVTGLHERSLFALKDKSVRGHRIPDSRNTHPAEHLAS